MFIHWDGHQGHGLRQRLSEFPHIGAHDDGKFKAIIGSFFQRVISKRLSGMCLSAMMLKWADSA
jgi:hypothetical protein